MHLWPPNNCPLLTVPQSPRVFSAKVQLATPRDGLRPGKAFDVSLDTHGSSWSSFRIPHPLQATKKGYGPAFFPLGSAVTLDYGIFWVWSLSCSTTRIPGVQLFPPFSVGRVLPPCCILPANQSWYIYTPLIRSGPVPFHLVSDKASSCADRKSAYRYILVAVTAGIPFFGLKMDSNGWWSVNSVKLLLYRYVLNFMTPTLEQMFLC